MDNDTEFNEFKEVKNNEFKEVSEDSLLVSLAKKGVNLQSAKFKKQIASLEAQAQKESIERNPNKNPEIAKKIAKYLSILSIFFTGVFLVGGSLTALILFPITEIASITLGVNLFAKNMFLALLTSVTIVIGYIVLTFNKYSLRHTLSSVPSSTLRRAWANLRYFLGISENKPTLTSSESLYLSSLGSTTLLKLTIALLSFVGRASYNMQSYDGTYYDFFTNIFTASNPVDFTGYIGTIILTFALLSVTDLIILFVHTNFVNSTGGIMINDDDDFLSERTRELKEQYYRELLIQLEAKEN